MIQQKFDETVNMLQEELNKNRVNLIKESYYFLLIISKHVSRIYI